jgi:hypothetical protein
MALPDNGSFRFTERKTWLRTIGSSHFKMSEIAILLSEIRVPAR